MKKLLPTRGSPRPPDSPPPSPWPARASAVGALQKLALFGLFFLTAVSAHASHFRGASLTWRRLATPANTIELTVTESWRAGASNGQSWNWGDSAVFNTSGATVIASGSDATGAFTVIRKVATHTYVYLSAILLLIIIQHPSYPKLFYW